MTIKNSKILATLMMTAFVVSAQADLPTPPACSDLNNQIKRLQLEKLKIKPEGENQKSLYELQREYDQILAEVSIVQELFKLNEKFHSIMSNNYDPVQDIVGYIDTVTADDNLQVMQNMALMDSMMTQLSEDTQLDFIGSSEDISFERIAQACIGKDNILCNLINSGDRSNATALITSFTEALRADTSRLKSEEKEQKLNAYRDVLRRGISPEADLAGVFAAAKELERHKNNPAFTILRTAEDMTKHDNADILRLKLTRCCTAFANQNDALNDSMCSQLGDALDFNKCSEVWLSESEIANSRERSRVTSEDISARQEAAFNNVVSAFNKYELRAYEALNYKIGDEPLQDQLNITPQFSIKSRTVFGRFFSSMGILASDTELAQERSSELTSQQNLHEMQRDELVKSSEQMVSSLKSIYQRGKIPHDTIANFLERGIKPTASQTVTEIDFMNLALEINKKMCSIQNKMSQSPSDCNNVQDFVKVEKNPLRIVPANSIAIRNLFSSENNAALKQDADEAKLKLQQKRAEIDTITNANKYQHLDQLMSFLIWDKQSRCSSDESQLVTVTGCGYAQDERPLTYLLDASEKILAEMDPSVVARRDITRANLSQRRIILGHMNGACAGLKNIYSADSSDPDVAAISAQSCGRIKAMNEIVQQKTDVERVVEIERGGRYIDSAGRIRRQNSTGKDLALGALGALPQATSTMAMPFFSGIALRGNIPGQEQYWKQVKFNQYATDWWATNNPYLGFPNMPYLGHSPFYGTPGVASGGFDFNQNGLNLSP